MPIPNMATDDSDTASAMTQQWHANGTVVIIMSLSTLAHYVRRRVMWL